MSVREAVDFQLFSPFDRSALRSANSLFCCRYPEEKNAHSHDGEVGTSDRRVYFGPR